jgi:hypothetical protein
VEALSATEDEKKSVGMFNATTAPGGAKMLALARITARKLATFRPTVNADEVRAEMVRMGIKAEWGNWAGSIFTGGDWEPVGYVKCAHEGGHSRIVRVWKLRK